MMRAISLWEPWASAMANGFKRIETRSWPTNYRGDLLICAAKRKIAVTAWMHLPVCIETMEMHYGCAVCIVEIYDCVRTELCTPDVIAGDEERLGDYGFDRFAWLTRFLRPLSAPIPWRGQQGMWTLTPDEETKIRSIVLEVVSAKGNGQ